jgi:serine phosphatase RsbU (regulator of sigma subunit)
VNLLSLNISKARKLEYSVAVSIILFVFKILFGSPESLASIFLNELLVFITLYLWMVYMIDLIHSNLRSPLAVILNVGILTAVIFFMISISSVIFDYETYNPDQNFITSIFSLLISFMMLSASAYIFSAFRELFFLRQKRDPRTYFNTMFVFFILLYFSNLLIKIDPQFDYPKNAFYVVALILISVNSLRVAWIAFLTKRQKVYLLILSVVLGVLFGFNFGLTLEENIITKTLIGFSAGFHSILSLLMIYGAIYFGVIFFTTLFHLPTAEAFDRKAEEVTSFRDLTRLITQVLDFKELANTITQLTTKICNSDSAWLVVINNDEYELSSVINIGYVEADKLSKKILEENQNDLEGLITLNPGTMEISIKNDLRKFDFNWIVVSPLKVHEKLKGFLFAARKKDFPFDDDDKNAIESFSDYASVAMENAMLIEESIEKERLEKELDVARDVQYKILPSKTPEYSNLQISALFVPAFEVGGDYYDFFKVDEEHLGIVVADVSGKGISAAFVMAEIKGIFESLTRVILEPKELLIKANKILMQSLDSKTFVTAVYGLLNTKTGKFKFVRCGHTPVIVIRDGTAERYTPLGIGLGLDDTDKFESTLKQMEIQLKNNDILTLYTDGIPEAQNSRFEDFGYDRFENILIENNNSNTEILSNKVMEQLTTFSKDNIQHDDITLLIMKWNFNNKPVGEN